jgi:hypothetical protein
MVDLLRRTNLLLDRFIPLVHRHREGIAGGKGAVHQPPALVEPPPPRPAGERLRFAKAPAENAF